MAQMHLGGDIIIILRSSTLQRLTILTPKSSLGIHNECQAAHLEGMWPVSQEQNTDYGYHVILLSQKA